MSDTNRCNGVKADGTRCGSTRMTNFSRRPSHLTTPTPWYCPAHRHQAEEASA
jgi:hypothetical protein